MTLKFKKLDQGTTEMFISEFEKEESLLNVISKIFKNRNRKKAIFKRFLELFEMNDNSFKFFPLFVYYFVC